MCLTELGKKHETARDTKVTTKAMTEILRTNWKKEGNKAFVWGLVAEDSTWWQEDVGRRKVTQTGTTERGVVLSFPLSWSSLLYEVLTVHRWSLRQYPMARRDEGQSFSQPSVHHSLCNLPSVCCCCLPTTKPFLFFFRALLFFLTSPKSQICLTSKKIYVSFSNVLM